MARTRLALVDVTGPYDGPWILSNGYREAIVRVHGLAPPAQLFLVFESKHTDSVLALARGENRVQMQNWERYKITKRAPNNDGIATTVEFEYLDREARSNV